MENEPKYRVGDVLVDKHGNEFTVKSASLIQEYRFKECHFSLKEHDLEYWKLKEPAEEMTLAEVCKELGRTIKIVK